MMPARPNPCPGRGLEQCTTCHRFNELPMPFQTVVQPELVDGRCTDYLACPPSLPPTNRSKP